MENLIKRMDIKELTEEEREFLFSKAGGRLAMVSFLRNDFISVWGVKNRRTDKEITYSELQRYYFTGETYTYYYVTYSHVGGYNAYLNEKQCNTNYARWDDELAEWLGLGNFYDMRNSAFNFFSEDEYHSVLYSKLPRGVEPSNKSFFGKDDRIEKFVACLPNSEFLLKQGGSMAKLAFKDNICKAPKEDQYAIRKYIMKHKSKLSKIKSDNIPLLAKFDAEPNEYEFICELNVLCTTLNERSESIRNAVHSYFCNERKLFEYLKEKGEDYGRYFKYLENCEKLGLLLDKGCVRPIDLIECENNAKARLSEIRNKELSDKIKAIATRLGEKKLSNGMVIKPMDCVAMFIDIGNKLHMCVGRMGYDKKMADGKSYCAVLYKGEEPQECCEINGKGEILQLYGDHDRVNGEYHELAKTEFTKYAFERKEINLCETL